MFSNVGKKCFKLRCVLCAVQFVSPTARHKIVYLAKFCIGSLKMVQMDRNM